MMREILVMDCEERGTFWFTLRANCRILFATTGSEGLEMLSQDIGLVFLSLALKDMDGMEVLKLIRKKFPSTAVVIIAPCGTEKPCRCMEAFRDGAWDYIKKPLKAEEILRKIEMVSTGRQDSQEGWQVPSSVATIQDEQYPDVPSHVVEGVLKVKDFVAENYSESLSLAAACRMAATSKTYFCRFFKYMTGHSLRGYHNVVRVKMAEQLLRDKRLSITDVAIRVGYSDSNYFSTVYKKITGCSPRYRKVFDQHLEKSEEAMNMF